MSGMKASVAIHWFYGGNLLVVDSNDGSIVDKVEAIGPAGANAAIEQGVTDGEDGIRTPCESYEETTLSLEGGAKSGAMADVDSDLAEVIDAWPNMPKPIRAGILAMVGAAGG
jgi:hypothetical protein